MNLVDFGPVILKLESLEIAVDKNTKSMTKLNKTLESLKA